MTEVSLFKFQIARVERMLQKVRYRSIREHIDGFNKRWRWYRRPCYSLQTSAISLKRRIVDLVAAAAGVLEFNWDQQTGLAAWRSFIVVSMWANLLTYDTVYAPPATVFLHALQLQIPTECLLTVVLPQNVQVYLACCVISIFLTCFRNEAPYLESASQLKALNIAEPIDQVILCHCRKTDLVPYLPVTPTSLTAISIPLARGLNITHFSCAWSL